MLGDELPSVKCLKAQPPYVFYKECRTFDLGLFSFDYSFRLLSKEKS